MLLKWSSCLFLQMCSLVGFSAQKPVSKTCPGYGPSATQEDHWPRLATPGRRPGPSRPLWAIGLCALAIAHRARIGPALGHRSLGHWATEPKLWGPCSTKAGAVEHAEEVGGELGLGPGGVGLAPRWSTALARAMSSRRVPPGAPWGGARGRAGALTRGHFDPAVALLRVLGHVRRRHRLLLNRVRLTLELVHVRLHLARPRRGVASAGAPRSTHLVAQFVQLR
jgi:hypothetical protein